MHTIKYKESKNEKGCYIGFTKQKIETKIKEHNYYIKRLENNEEINIILITLSYCLTLITGIKLIAKNLCRY